MGRSPQPVKYRDVEDLLLHLPPDELEIMNTLRDLVQSTWPRCREKLRYNVPFFYLKKRSAYIWPASVPWGGIRSGVVLGFTQGSRLLTQDFFQPNGAKHIRQLHFYHRDEIKPEIVKLLLLEASAVDAQS